MALNMSAVRTAFGPAESFQNSYFLITYMTYQKNIVYEVARPPAPFIVMNCLCEIYDDREDRLQNFGQAKHKLGFSFEYVPGEDLLSTAYNAVKNQGLPGWDIRSAEDNQ